MKQVITGFLAIIFLTGCIDTFDRKYWKHKDYYIGINPGNNTKTLYLSLPGGSGIGRIDNVTKVSVVEDFILSESFSDMNKGTQQYWVINMQHDNNLFNAEEIVKGPFDKDEFSALLKEYKITDLSWKSIE